jgi:integrase
VTALDPFAAFSGARKAECFALRWSEVDLTPGSEVVRIVRSSTKANSSSKRRRSPARARSSSRHPQRARSANYRDAPRAHLPHALTEQLVEHVDERTHRGYTRPIPGTEPLIRRALGAAFNKTYEG